MWEVIARALKINLVMIPPITWKSKLKLGSDKEKSRLKAIKLFPELFDHLRLKQDHDKSEALLLGYYARTILELK